MNTWSNLLNSVGIALSVIVATYATSPTENDRLYLVNTPGCRMPAFPEISPDIERFFYTEKPIICRTPLTRSNATHLWVALNASEAQHWYPISDIAQVLCIASPLRRTGDSSNYIYHNESIYFGWNDVIAMTENYVQVRCVLVPDNTMVYLDYHYFVQIEHTEQSSQRIDPNKMNVMVIGIDAVSRLNFRRQMPLTLDVLLRELDAIEMLGYNKVGDNTYPNLMPVLTGYSEAELQKICVPSRSDHYDRCPFVWDAFREKGYETVFAEDTAAIGLFNYLRAGFAKQTPDHRLRPVLLQMEKDINDLKIANCFMCLGGRRTADLLLDYIDKFVHSVRQLPFFSFFWTTNYSHDYLNMPRLIDREYSQYLLKLRDSGTLNNTFLVVMSDHGLRFGSFRNTYQGQIEERQPMMYLVPPPWFASHNPRAAANLQANRHRLTTPFDLHETLADIASLQLIGDASIETRSTELQQTIGGPPRGISWFLPVPESRTCAQADIDPHLCTCHESRPLQVTDGRVTHSAQIVMDSINELLAEHSQCDPLEISYLSHAHVGEIGESETGAERFEDVTVMVITVPGEAQFEATVRLTQSAEGMVGQVMGTISRTNLYGDQSHCIGDARLKLYCYSQTNAAIFIAYIALFVGQGILVTASQNSANGYGYNTLIAVLLTDVLKILVSVVLYLRQHSTVSLVRNLIGGRKLLALYFVPAMLYCIYNNLTYVNLAVFDPTTYYVLLQFRVVITGVLFQVIFAKYLSPMQWFSLVLLTLGCILNQIKFTGESQRLDILNPATVLILGQAACSSLAGVYNEHLLKCQGPDVHIFVQNIFMHLASIVYSVLLMLSSKEPIVFAGIGQPTVLMVIANNAAIGIVTSLFLKYLNSILKTFASALELMLTAIVCNFLFAIPIRSNTILAIFIVTISIFIYAKHPVPPKTRDQIKKQL